FNFTQHKKNIYMKTHLTKLALSALLFAFVSCSSDDDAATPASQPTIAELATSNPDLSILVDALNRTDLTGTLNQDGAFTVFAPTNDAFTAFLSAQGFANLDAVPTAALREILLN